MSALDAHDKRSLCRRRFLKEIEALFVQVLLLAREMGVLKMGTVALDGTKIHANASRHGALSYEHAVQRKLLTPEMTALAVEGYREEFAKAQGERSGMTERLKSELADVSRKMGRLLRLVEDGHTDPAVAGPRLNEMAAQKRRLAGELALRPEDNSEIAVTDGGAGFRQLVRKLQEELRAGERGNDEAAELVRGLVNRIIIRPVPDGGHQPIVVQAGIAPKGAMPGGDCIVGCGGAVAQQLRSYFQ